MAIRLWHRAMTSVPPADILPLQTGAPYSSMESGTAARSFLVLHLGPLMLGMMALRDLTALFAFWATVVACTRKFSLVYVHAKVFDTVGGYNSSAFYHYLQRVLCLRLRVGRIISVLSGASSIPTQFSQSIMISAVSSSNSPTLKVTGALATTAMSST